MVDSRSFAMAGRVPDQLIECFGLEIEVAALGIAHEQSLALEQPGDARADRV